ncbi:MAG: SDR family NAD(P)-dependent oxidoreductase [Kiritimatiellae bacterium]|nr:SDR family NAD(P)-dependent oxidoreductase [Kiritimatiellia bacterium]
MDWKDRAVLVTGAGGFIGSHLAERLVQLGARVRALVHYNALGSWGWLNDSALRADMEIVAGDISDQDSVRQAVANTEVVFHLAALIAIPYSYHVPASYVRTNVLGTLNVLQAVRESGVRRMIHTSTSEVYGTARRVPIDEEHALQGQSPYSASKIGADKMVEAFHASFGVPAVIVRPFNTFGPRQSARAVIPTIITQCLANGRARLGNLGPTRDFNYVDNTVDGFVLAAEKDEAVGRTINLGSGREISVRDLARLIGDLAGSPIHLETDQQRVRPEKSEVERLLSDNRLAREVLGWTPRVTLEEGLKRTIDWIRGNPEHYRVDTYTV